MLQLWLICEVDRLLDGILVHTREVEAICARLKAHGWRHGRSCTKHGHTHLHLARLVRS